MIGPANRKSFKSGITRTKDRKSKDSSDRTEMTPFSMTIIMSGTVHREKNIFR
jgi:hypothetical protein